jgi:hypothetical protein
VGARHDVTEVTRLLAALTALHGNEAGRWQTAGLNGLASGMGNRGIQLSAFLATLTIERAATLSGKVDRLFEEAAGRAGDAAPEPVERLDAVRLLAHAPWPTAEPVLARLVRDDSAPQVQLAAVRALAFTPAPKWPGCFWARGSPLRRACVAKSWRRCSSGPNGSGPS